MFLFSEHLLSVSTEIPILKGTDTADSLLPAISDQNYLRSLHASADIATNLLVSDVPTSSVPYVPTHGAAHHSRQLPGPHTASKPTITLWGGYRNQHTPSVQPCLAKTPLLPTGCLEAAEAHPPSACLATGRPQSHLI